MKLLIFIGGFTVGCLFGVTLMCLLQAHRLYGSMWDEE